jgi:membrane protease YdiL (CAAX protease family)
MFASIFAWGVLMRHFGGGIYRVMGPFASTVLIGVAVLTRKELCVWFRPTRIGIGSGLAVGVLMTLATYPVYGLASALSPELGGRVASLYQAAQQTKLAEAWLWMPVIVLAEELLWRGALLHVLSERVPQSAAMAISIASYALAQLGTGSWIVMLLAAVCGSIWTLQRYLTHSLLSPLLAHLIWTPAVILLYPVNMG